MISSESINYSKYSMINNNNNQSNDLEILETKENSVNNKDKGEMSQKLIVSEKEKKENNDDNINFTFQISDTLYGNPYNKLKPKYIGKCLAFFYDKSGNPRMTIGPDCKYFILNYHLNYNNII